VSYLHKIHDSLPQSKGYLKNGLDLYRLLSRKKISNKEIVNL